MADAAELWFNCGREVTLQISLQCPERSRLAAKMFDFYGGVMRRGANDLKATDGIIQKLSSSKNNLREWRCEMYNKIRKTAQNLKPAGKKTRELSASLAGLMHEKKMTEDAWRIAVEGCVRCAVEAGIEADEFTLKRNNLVEKSQLLEALERAEELAQMGEQHDRDAQEEISTLKNQLEQERKLREKESDRAQRAEAALQDSQLSLASLRASSEGELLKLKTAHNDALHSTNAKLSSEKDLLKSEMQDEITQCKAEQAKLQDQIKCLETVLKKVHSSVRACTQASKSMTHSGKVLMRLDDGDIDGAVEMEGQCTVGGQSSEEEVDIMGVADVLSESLKGVTQWTSKLPALADKAATHAKTRTEIIRGLEERFENAKDEALTATGNLDALQNTLQDMVPRATCAEMFTQTPPIASLLEQMKDQEDQKPPSRAETHRLPSKFPSDQSETVQDFMGKYLRKRFGLVEVQANWEAERLRKEMGEVFETRVRKFQLSSLI